jgi:hypothetical protein
MIQREISRVLVLNLSGEASGAAALPGYFVLDSAFALIEGHPRRFAEMVIASHIAAAAPWFSCRQRSAPAMTNQPA